MGISFLGPASGSAFPNSHSGGSLRFYIMTSAGLSPASAAPPWSRGGPGTPASRPDCWPCAPGSPPCAPRAWRAAAVRGAGRRSATCPPGPAPARAGGGVMSRQEGGAGAAGPAGRRGRCFPALKRQEAQLGPASEPDLESQNLPAQSPPGRGAGAGTGARAHPPSPTAATPLGCPGRGRSPRAHTPPKTFPRGVRR